MLLKQNAHEVQFLATKLQWMQFFFFVFFSEKYSQSCWVFFFLLILRRGQLLLHLWRVLSGQRSVVKMKSLNVLQLC